ncbi:hypothetical protein AB6A40_003460 [Gnathostoma spinigerum]|uniref:C2H2-type domain-containing protein n=1 Tax=Gnathostoma spinigerum TaxID=75299 RepID=A0ABD6EH89_9BILA
MSSDESNDWSGVEWDEWKELVRVSRTSASQSPPRSYPKVFIDYDCSVMHHHKAMAYGYYQSYEVNSMVLVTCELCGMVIKDVAFVHHMRSRHSLCPPDPPSSDESSDDVFESFLLTPPHRNISSHTRSDCSSRSTVSSHVHKSATVAQSESAPHLPSCSKTKTISPRYSIEQRDDLKLALRVSRHEEDICPKITSNGRVLQKKRKKRRRESTDDEDYALEHFRRKKKIPIGDDGFTCSPTTSDVVDENMIDARGTGHFDVASDRAVASSSFFQNDLMVSSIPATEQGARREVEDESSSNAVSSPPLSRDQTKHLSACSLSSFPAKDSFNMTDIPEYINTCSLPSTQTDSFQNHRVSRSCSFQGSGDEQESARRKSTTDFSILTANSSISLSVAQDSLCSHTDTKSVSSTASSPRCKSPTICIPLISSVSHISNSPASSDITQNIDPAKFSFSVSKSPPCFSYHVTLPVSSSTAVIAPTSPILAESAETSSDMVRHETSSASVNSPSSVSTRSLFREVVETCRSGIGRKSSHRTTRSSDIVHSQRQLAMMKTRPEIIQYERRNNSILIDLAAGDDEHSFKQESQSHERQCGPTPDRAAVHYESLRDSLLCGSYAHRFESIGGPQLSVKEFEHVSDGSQADDEDFSETSSSPRILDVDTALPTVYQAPTAYIKRVHRSCSSPPLSDCLTRVESKRDMLVRRHYEDVLFANARAMVAQSLGVTLEYPPLAKSSPPAIISLCGPTNYAKDANDWKTRDSALHASLPQFHSENCLQERIQECMLRRPHAFKTQGSDKTDNLGTLLVPDAVSHLLCGGPGIAMKLVCNELPKRHSFPSSSFVHADAYTAPHKVAAERTFTTSRKVNSVNRLSLHRRGHLSGRDVLWSDRATLLGSLSSPPSSSALLGSMIGSDTSTDPISRSQYSCEGHIALHSLGLPSSFCSSPLSSCDASAFLSTITDTMSTYTRPYLHPSTPSHISSSVSRNRNMLHAVSCRSA